MKQSEAVSKLERNRRMVLCLAVNVKGEFMKVKSKAYTLSRLIGEVQAVKKASTLTDFANQLSPRAGFKSAKWSVINSFLGGKLTQVAVTGRGATIKARVLNALKTRKKTGSF